MIEVTKKAILFDKAIADFYVAEAIYSYRPDVSLYHLHQCVEKMIKGALYCYNEDNSVHGHDIIGAIDSLSAKVNLSNDCVANCYGIANHSQSALRYKNMRSDPTKETVKAISKKVHAIMSEISKLPEVERYYKEALEVNLKMLNHSEERETDLERKPLNELLQEVKQHKPKKKENEINGNNKNRKQEYIK